MPEQASGRGQVITTATFEAPFSTEIFPFGAGGLNLKDALDAIPVGQLSRSTNMIHSQDRAVTGRPGLTSLATVGTEHHSVRRLSDPQAGTYTRIWGVDQKLYRGQSGALTEIDTGYSGDPLYLLPHRPPLSGDPWMFVADRLRMRKVRADGLDLPIGLPAPAAALVTALATEEITYIAKFDPNLTPNAGVDDGTAGVNWTGTAGFDYSVPPLTTGVPIVVGSEFITNPGAAIESAKLGYNSWWGLPRVLDLSLTGTRPADDNDILNFVLKFSHPYLTEEVRFYFVCGAFDPTVLPGTDTTGNNLNGDFFEKTFRPGDFAVFLQGKQASADAAEGARIQELRRQGLLNQSEAKGFEVVRTKQVTRKTTTFTDLRDPVRDAIMIAGSGLSEFIEIGTVGIPLRRGEFKRYGSTANTGWNTITGLVIYIQAAEGAAGPIGVTFINMYQVGGYGPDSMEPGAQSYDIRYTNYDPRTGAEGNPSPEQDDASFLDPRRQKIDCTPVAYGDAAVRQRFYVRGGTLIEDWYFAGVNAADGGVFSHTERWRCCLVRRRGSCSRSAIRVGPAISTTASLTPLITGRPRATWKSVRPQKN
jgi:hypothetical protein